MFQRFCLCLLCLIYPETNVSTHSTHTLGHISVSVNTHPARAKVITRKNGKIVRCLSFDTIYAMGGSAGLFIPEQQPLENYFLVSKFGGYDGRLIVVDTSGRIFNLYGGSFYISGDLHYIITNHERDGGNYGFTVFDIFKGEKTYYSGEIRYRNDLLSLGHWYMAENGFYCHAETFNNEYTVHYIPGIKQYHLVPGHDKKGKEMKKYNVLY